MPSFDRQLQDPIWCGSLFAVSRELAGRRGVLLFSNPENVGREVNIGRQHFPDRTNMTVKLSLNDGSEGDRSLVLEAGFWGYSDLCVAPDGTASGLCERGVLTSHYAPATLPLARYDLRQWLSASTERT